METKFHKWRRTAGLTVLLLVTVSACRDQLPDMSDEELVVLIGDVRPFSDRPYITKRMLECVRLLGGLDREIYKDLASPLLGTLRTGCRIELDKKLKDPERNTRGAKLAHFEDPAVGERATRLFASLEEEDARRRREDQLRREARKKAEATERLEVLRRKVRDLSERIDDRLTAAEENCREWNVLRDRVVAANRFSVWRSRLEPELCIPSRRSEVREGIAKARALLHDLRVEGDILLFRIPSLGPGDPTRVESLFAALAKNLEELRKDASE